MLLQLGRCAALMTGSGEKLPWEFRWITAHNILTQPLPGIQDPHCSVGCKEHECGFPGDQKINLQLQRIIISFYSEEVNKDFKLREISIWMIEKGFGSTSWKRILKAAYINFDIFQATLQCCVHLIRYQLCHSSGFIINMWDSFSLFSVHPH